MLLQHALQQATRCMAVRVSSSGTSQPRHRPAAAHLVVASAPGPRRGQHADAAAAVRVPVARDQLQHQRLARLHRRLHLAAARSRFYSKSGALTFARRLHAVKLRLAGILEAQLTAVWHGVNMLSDANVHALLVGQSLDRRPGDMILTTCSCARIICDSGPRRSPRGAPTRPGTG